MTRCCVPGLSSLLAQAGIDPRRRRDAAEVALWDAGVDARRRSLGSPSCAPCRCRRSPSSAITAHVAPALAAGARGVVLRDQVGPGIHAALAAVRSGLTVMDTALAESARAAQPAGRRHHANGKGRGELTEREKPGRAAPVRGPVEQADRGSPRHQRSHGEVPRQRRDDEARRFDPDRGRRRGDAPRPDPARSALGSQPNRSSATRPVSPTVTPSSSSSWRCIAAPTGSWIAIRPRSLSGLADHALPRQLVGGLARLHRCAGDARAAGDPGELGDLAVRRDVAARDLANDRVDPLEQRAQVFAVARRHRGPRHTAGRPREIIVGRPHLSVGSRGDVPGHDPRHSLPSTRTSDLGPFRRIRVP